MHKTTRGTKILFDSSCNGKKKTYVEVGTDQSEDQAYCPSAYLYLGKQHFSTDIGLFLSFLMGRKQSRTSLLEPVCCKKR